MAFPPNTRQSLLKKVDNAREELIRTTQELVRIPTETPPSDTSAAVRFVNKILTGLSDVQVTVLASEPPITNLVAKVKADTPGKRLVLNGHLDTYPAGDHDAWSDSPVLRRGSGRQDFRPRAPPI